MHTRELGRYGEDAAIRYLLERGYELVERNFHTRYGELDLVMRHGRELVFVEVKARSNTRYGRPEDAITTQKLRRIRKNIYLYLQQRSPRFAALRIDVIAIDLEPDSYRVVDIRHYQNVG